MGVAFARPLSKQPGRRAELPPRTCLLELGSRGGAGRGEQDSRPFSGLHAIRYR